MLFMFLQLLSCAVHSGIEQTQFGGNKKDRREKVIKKNILSTKIKLLKTKMELSKCRAQIREMKKELGEINLKLAQKEAEINE